MLRVYNLSGNVLSIEGRIKTVSDLKEVTGCKETSEETTKQDDSCYDIIEQGPANFF